jgi:uncharacterized phiE125 gp8 family phage protein
MREIKEHLRIPRGFTFDDDYLERLHDVATAWVEDYTNRKLAQQRWKVYLDEWPDSDSIYLPLAPLSSAPSTAIVYKDSDGDSTTFSSSAWEFDTVSSPGRIALKYSEDWPTATLWNVNPISVEFLCGQASTAIPEKIKHAILLVIGDLYENRENTVLGVQPHKLRAAERLLYSERVFKF